MDCSSVERSTFRTLFLVMVMRMLYDCLLIAPPLFVWALFLFLFLIGRAQSLAAASAAIVTANRLEHNTCTEHRADKRPNWYLPIANRPFSHSFSFSPFHRKIFPFSPCSNVCRPQLCNHYLHSSDLLLLSDWKDKSTFLLNLLLFVSFGASADADDFVDL